MPARFITLTGEKIEILLPHLKDTTNTRIILNVDAENISIYPNPVLSEEINVLIPFYGEDERYSIEITDIFGMRILKQNISRKNSVFSIEVEEKGILIVIIKKGSQIIHNQKIVKM
ncbi:MAG: T9SS type A sorting domain-containing protein [Saprospiraceae bacterium]|nr:T9SS type A sorting domain-containing protein [Saprospiraceae bacterium]